MAKRTTIPTCNFSISYLKCPLSFSNAFKLVIIISLEIKFLWFLIVMISFHVVLVFPSYEGFQVYTRHVDDTEALTTGRAIYKLIDKGFWLSFCTQHHKLLVI